MIFIAKGTWRDSRGASHQFEIESDRAERRFITELVEAQYPTSRVVVNSVRQRPTERFSPVTESSQAIRNSESTPVTSGNIGLGPVGNFASSITESDDGEGNPALGLVALFALIAAGYIVWFSAPVIAFVGSGGLAFKAVKNRTSGMQWAKRTGAFLLATGLVSMTSFHGTIATQESIATWWSENVAEEVSSN